MSLSNLISEYDVFLFDIWGVIIEGNEVHHKAVETINEIKQKKDVIFVTNSPFVGELKAKELQKIGVDIEDNRVITAGDVAIDFVNSKGNQVKLFHLGKERYEATLTKISAEIVRDIKDANLILISENRDESEDYSDVILILKEALEMDLELVCANPDEIIVNGDSHRICPGYFAKMYEKMGGKVVYTGKPLPQIFDKALKLLGPQVKMENVLMVGDTFETDIIGSNNLGMKSAMVTTGNIGEHLKGLGSLEEKIKIINKFAGEKNIKPYMVLDLINQIYQKL